MPIDDPLEISIRQLDEDIGEGDWDIRGAAMHGLLSSIPVAGDAISNLLDGKAQKHVLRRIAQLFRDMRATMEAVRDAVPDSRYYESQEFQVLLSLGLEQLWTTNDERKRRMLAAALANSGTTRFRQDARKEQFVRTLRDLGPDDIGILSLLRQQLTSFRGAAGETRSSLNRLIALGLAEQLAPEKTIPMNGYDSAEEAWRKFIETALSAEDREFRISEYGELFLEFMTSPGRMPA